MKPKQTPPNMSDLPRITMLDAPEEDWQGQLKWHLDHLKMLSHELKKEDWKKRFEYIREGYMIMEPRILERAKKGRTVNPYFLVWDWSPIEYNAWTQIRRLALPLYPQYPFLHFFLDFADPYRKICIELDGRKYHDAAKDALRDEALARWGWQVYRIPGTVANTWKTDVLPEHLHFIDEEGGEEEEIAERREWDERLEMTTIDGFFEWIKAFYYSPAALRAEQEQSDDSGPVIFYD